MEYAHCMNKNNFDGVRIGLALIVVFSHLAVLTQLPMFAFLGHFFDARFAVEGFFAISGYLVTKSFYSSRSTLEYLEKRIRRICPAYVTAVLLCLCIGACSTSLSLRDFFQHVETYKYLLANLTFLNFIQPSLPQAFQGNPLNAMDGSLWTIKIEIMLYFCVPLLVWGYRRLGALPVTAAAVVLSVAWVYYFQFMVADGKGLEMAKQFPGQLAYFALGGLFAVDKRVAAQLPWIVLAGTILLCTVSAPVAKLIIDPLAYAAIVIYLATAAWQSLNFGKYGDVSYGIYLYHFPIIQTLIFVGVFAYAPWLGVLLALLLTLLAAWLSWHLIEKRMLKRTSHYVLAARS